jgi:hypothetical protein
MKCTKRKHNKTRRKKRNNKKTKRTIFTNKNKKTRKQRGSGKYKPNDIYNIDQFITNDCLNVLKRELKPSEKGMFSKMFKSSDPYVKCRRSMRVFNSEKMPPNEYLRYRQIINVTKNDPYYSNSERGNVEDIGKNYIFDYIFSLHGKLFGGGTTALQNLLQVISPCYLVKVLTLDNYYDFAGHLAEKSKIKKEEGKYSASITTGLKRHVGIENIYNWVKDTNFELFKLKSPQDLINLFESYYPINCPYLEELNHFERINITATQVQETNARYVSNSSWDLYLDFTYDDFYSDYLLKSRYDFKKVYSDLVGESFERPLSTNIVDSNGEIVFKSTDNYEDQLKSNLDKLRIHFNNFIRKLNDVGGGIKFEPKLPPESTNVEDYTTVHTNQFIVNILKFLAMSMVPLLSYVTKIKLRPNYYGLFYHYYEENYQGDIPFEDNTNFEYVNLNYTQITKIEVDTINHFINKHIPDNNYEKCVLELRKYEPHNLFPSCRIIDLQNKVLFTFNYFMITMPNVISQPNCIVGRYFQIIKFNNINDFDVENNNVTAHGLILWGGNMNENASADIPTSLTSSEYKEDTLDKIVHMFVGNTFYNGFMQPIFSSLQENTSERSSVRSSASTPRNTSERSSVRSSASTPRNTSERSSVRSSASTPRNTSERSSVNSSSSTPRNTSETSSVRSSASTPRNTIAQMMPPTRVPRDSIEGPIQGVLRDSNESIGSIVELG